MFSKFSSPISLLVITAALLMAGILGNTLADPNTIHFTKELNPIHALSVLVTLFGIIYVSTKLDAQKESKRKLRECIQRRLQDLGTKVSTLMEYGTASNSTVCVTEVNRQLKLLGIAGTQICEISNEVNIIRDSQLLTFPGKWQSLLVCMTTFSVPDPEQGDTPDVVVNDNLIVYSFGRKAEIKRICEDLLNLISRE